MPDLKDYLGIKVERGFLQNLDNGRISEFLFNPTQLEERHQPKYVFHGSPGLSHERMQYVGNKNLVIPLELIFDQLVFDRRRNQGELGIGANDVENWRRRLMEITYPRQSQRLASASPPPVLFNWPEMFNMRVRVTSLTMRTVQFATGNRGPRMMVAQVTLTEDPAARIYSEDMMRLGTYRPWAPRVQGSR